MKPTLKWILPAVMSLLSPVATTEHTKRVGGAETRDVATELRLDERGIGSMRRGYVSVRAKFILATGFGVGWLAISAWMAGPWITDLSQITGGALAVLIVAGIA